MTATSAPRVPDVWPPHDAHPVCADHNPETWFPRNAETFTRAVSLCRQCPFLDMCGAVAEARKEYGVWGGALFDRGRKTHEFPTLGRPRKTTTRTEAN